MTFTYVLELTDNKYYIGKTLNPEFRLEQHFTNNGSKWTQKYKPIKTLELIPNCDKFDEDKYTLKYMEKFGINNVRGGSFCEFDLSKENMITIQQMLNGSSDKCYACGKTGHFIKECTGKTNNALLFIKEEHSVKENDSFFNSAIKIIGSYISSMIDNLTQHENIEPDIPINETPMMDNLTQHENIEPDAPKKCDISVNENDQKCATDNKSYCVRCKRFGHVSNKCYAATYKSGGIIPKKSMKLK